MNQNDTYFEHKYYEPKYLDYIFNNNKQKKLNNLSAPKIYELEPMTNKDNNIYLIFNFLFLICLFFYLFQKK
jgi:hypothetical protein